MAISVKHAFASPKADGTDSTLVQPSNWNAEHTITLAAGKVLGRDSSGAGAMQELPLSFSSAGAATFSNSLTVTGPLTANSAVNFSSSLGVSGVVSFSNTLNVTGVVSLGNALNVTSNISSSGNIYASGNVTAYSDISLKRDVETLSSALKTVNLLRGVSYEMIATGERGIGVIAQEVAEVLPELVHEHNGLLSVAYGNITAVLIEAVKELSSRVEKLEG